MQFQYLAWYEKFRGFWKIKQMWGVQLQILLKLEVISQNILHILNSTYTSRYIYLGVKSTFFEKPLKLGMKIVKSCWTTISIVLYHSYDPFPHENLTNLNIDSKYIVKIAQKIIIYLNLRIFRIFLSYVRLWL